MKYLLNLLFFLLIYIGSYCVENVSIYTCPSYQLHFQKILDYRPAVPVDPLKTILINNRNTTSPLAINIDCWNQCMDDIDCIGYLLLFNSSHCYGYTRNSRSTKYTLLTDEDSLVQDKNAVYFEKICFKNVPAVCNQKLWLFTKIRGNSLIYQGKKTINNLVSASNCSEMCLMEQEFKCLSATFITSYRNNYMRSLGNRKIHNPLGTCILSEKDKSYQPDAFRVSSDDEEYIENQCVERGTEQDSCSYELYSDSRLIYADVEYTSLSQRECREKCATEKRFFCQGVSYFDPKTGLRNTRCLIHSEDIISLGPRSLVPQKNFIYMKRVKCLNVSVTCSSNEMIVNYTPYESFLGRLYVSSHSEECSSQGKGAKSAILRLPIGNEMKEKKCGIIRAFQLNDGTNSNRTLVSTLVVIQTNPIVQTQGDRLVKVGCILDNNVNETIGDVALGSSLTFSRSDPPNQGTKLYNISEAYPKVSMQVIDLNEKTKITDVELGQDLELQIILDPPNSVYDIRAVQLIAKSDTGHNSILLIDHRGCPTDLSVFPALEKRVTNTAHLLVARFHAFKFAGSSFVNFEVKIQFCLHECPAVSCGRNVWSRGRKKRSEPDTANAIRITSVPFTMWPLLNKTANQLNFNEIKNRNLLKQSNKPTLHYWEEPNEVYGYATGTKNTIKNDAKDELRTNEHLIRIQPNSIISQRVLSKTDNSSDNIVAANVMETSRRNFTNNIRILKQIDEVPLQIKLNVRAPEATESDNPIYGENNQILVAEFGHNNENLICLNQILVIILLLFWLVIQMVVFSCCWILIRKYKRLSSIDDDQSSLDKIHRAFEIDNLNRRVHWADQGRSQVLMYT